MTGVHRATTNGNGPPADSPRLFLASASPRRRELLTAAGYRFEVRPAPVTESASAQLTAAELVCLNARRKARVGSSGVRASSVPGLPSFAVVLGADTLVSLDGAVLGKPRDRADAFAMLSRLAGRTHEVLTGVCLLPVGSGNAPRAWVESTTVTFRALRADDIRAYLARIDPLDKAGAYAAQEHGAEIIAETTGSWSNVLGLPMESLSRELTALGIRTEKGKAPTG